MKRKLTVIICLSLLVINTYAQKVTHSTYLVGHHLTSIEHVDQIDFRQFDFIYLMAAPTWNTSDFKQPADSLLQQLVTNHQYPKDQGAAVIPHLIQEAHKAKTQVLLSFAGEGFKEKVESPEMRHKLIQTMVAFVEKYGYDGIEIDWESDLDLQLHADFIADIRAALLPLEKTCGKKMYLTTALHSWQKYSKILADKLSANVDWINVMTYDMGGGIWGNIASHNTPLDQIEYEMKNWEVFSRDKLCIGLANYGFIYHGILPGQKVDGKLDKYGSYIGYNDMLPLLQQGWTEEYDSQAKVSYFYSTDRQSFITMETPQTITTKVQWIKQHKYRGMFWWEFSYDTIIPDKTNKKIRHHLMDVAK